MDPATLAMMYAMNVGIEALQGKRGSNLWKDAFKDTTTQALTMQFTGGLDKGAKVPPVDSNNLMLKNVADKGITQTGNKFLANEELLQQAIDKGSQSTGDRAVETFLKRNPLKNVTEQKIKDPTFFEKYVQQPWEKTAGVFKSENPVLGRDGQPIYDKAGEMVMRSETDPVKVGLGSLGLGAGLYAAGAFDPVPPPEPKYPGYNKFYAENPGQFMPYDDPNIDPIDYSKYPDKPYSGIKQGGIIGLQGGGDVEMSDNDFALLVFNKPLDQLSPHQLQALQPYLINKAQGGIAAFAKGGRASNQPNQSIVEATSEEESRRLRQLGIPHQDPGLTPEEVIPRGGPRQGSPRIPYEREEDDGSNGGIGGYGPGRKVLPEGHFSPTPQIDPRWFHPDNPRFLRPDVQGVKTGALIHRLPSKTKVDEDNPKNYKRTSGKLVVDKAGKGSENKDTMLAQLADGEFVTKSKAVRGAGLALGANPKDKKQQKDLGARYFYKQMAEFDKLAKQMAS